MINLTEKVRRRPFAIRGAIIHFDYNSLYEVFKTKEYATTNRRLTLCCFNKTRDMMEMLMMERLQEIQGGYEKPNA